MKSFFSLILVLFLLPNAYSILLVSKDISVRNQNFNEDWEFKFEDGTNWKKLDLPHDYSISQNFDENMEAQSGFLPGGNAIYRKDFILKKPEEDAKVLIYFYGVYKDAYVYLNGNYLGENHYGYNSFGFDLTNYIKWGEQNQLIVNVHHDIPSSRFYSGSGIYRGVELIITGLVHVELDGLKITTPDIEQGKGTVKIETEVVNEKELEANIKIKAIIKDKNDIEVASYKSTNIETIRQKETKIIASTLNVPNPNLWFDTAPYLYTLELQLLNQNDEPIDHYKQKFGFRFYKFDKTGFTLNNRHIKLNGVSNHHDHGALGSIDEYDAVYRKFIQLKDMGINSIRTTHNIASKIWINLADELGIIIVEELFDGWTYSKEYNTHDFGEYFNVIIPPENHILGRKEGMHWYEFALTSVVRRDRNNPSVIMWSLGNELSTGADIDQTYVTFTKKMIDLANSLDGTRPCTTGDNNSFKAFPNRYHVMVAEMIYNNGGIQGYNYAGQDELRTCANKYGSVYLSESASAINSRGIYSLIDNGDLGLFHDGNYHLTAYDTSYVNWGYPAHRTLWYTLANDFVSGQYVWTGHDYIGEPTPWNGKMGGSVTGYGAIPNSAYFGIIDTAGFPKDSYYLYRAQLNHDSYTVHIVNSWDQKNMCYSDIIFQTHTPVFIYTNAKKVDVFRSDIENSICSMTGTKVTTNSGIIYYTFTMNTYNSSICEVVQPSTLGANMYGRFNIYYAKETKLYTKAYDENGILISPDKIVGNHFIQTPNLSKLRISAISDKTTLKANGHNLAHIEISIVDDSNILNTVANNLLKFKLEGPGKILGVDNGDQATTKKYQQKTVLFDEKNAEIKCFSGKALIILSSTKTAGIIRLNISSENLPSTQVEIVSN